MTEKSKHEEVAVIMRQMNRSWLDGLFKEFTTLLHPEIVMVFPGFTGRIGGREDFLTGFLDFTQNAIVLEFHESDYQIDIAGDTAVINYIYEMVFERNGERYHATGRDFWVFQKQDKSWLAVWRTMFDVDEKQLSAAVK